MTEEERTVFIKEKLVPLFKGMNANDVLEITNDGISLREVVLYAVFGEENE
jgi:hypothetical protein